MRRAMARALATAATLLLLTAPAAADTPPRGDFDARPTAADAASPRALAQDALRDRLGRFGLVAEEQRTGTPRAVARLNGFLTPASPRPGADVALDYVRGNLRVFGLEADDVAGLRLTGRTFTGGVEYLRWEQRYRGIPSSDTQLEAAVTGAGRLLSVTGPAAADLTVPSIVPDVGAEQAYAAVRRSGRTTRPEVAMDERAAGPQRSTTFADGGTASLVLYQDGDGARLGWRVLAPVSDTEVYDATVDATSGAVVRRANRVDFAGDALIYRASPESGPDQVPLTGWLDQGATTLKGPNAHAFVDPKDRVGFGQYAVAAEDEIGPVGGDWIFPLDTDFPSDGCAPPGCTWDHSVPGSWLANRAQSATQLFYLVNTFQAHLAQQPISFATGGFSGDDPVLAQAMDGADGPAGVPDAGHVNNASFLTLPDGTPGLLQSHLFSDDPERGFGDVDAANDASVIYHEYAHGLSGRLVTDGQGFAALDTPQAGAIAEGTSDFYAMDHLVASGLVADDEALADVRLGRYLDQGDPDGMRYQAIDCAPLSPDAGCPATPGTNGGGFTYADFGDVYGEPEVHSDGEIWAQTLWDIRRRLDVEKARAVITGGLRLAPPQPSFLDMRNAILQASTEDDDALWEVFAARGMGYFASTDGSRDLQPVANEALPPAPGDTGSVAGVVEDEQGAALEGAVVGVAGHDTVFDGELGEPLRDTTDASGRYEIPGVAVGVYRLLTSHRAGYRDGRATNVGVDSGVTTQVPDLLMARDWASAPGAAIERFTGPDYTDSGCGPAGLIDDEPGGVWGTDSDPGGHLVVVDLGVPIYVDQVAIDPGAGCGDDPTAGLRQYAVRGATGPDGPFQTLSSGVFAPLRGGFLRNAPTTDTPAVRFVELQALTPQSANGDGAAFLDVAELHVARKPGSALGPSVETGAATSVSTRTARVTGTVIPRGADVTTSFQYGMTTAYGATITSAGVTAGNTAAPVTRDLTGLQPGTTYHYRFVARQNGVDYPGGDLTFTTAPAVVAPTPTPTPAATPTPTPVPPDGDPAVATAIMSKRLTADRRGMFKVRWTFGDAAPKGKARISVIGKRRKRIASATVEVRPGRAITKTLRLTKAGRTMIKRGRSLRVSVELRLPGGGTLRERVRLSRKR
jgi:hypothetical protein